MAKTKSKLKNLESQETTKFKNRW